MLVRGMIDDKIHNQPHAARMNLAEQAVEILHRAKFPHDFPVITDIVAVVVIGRVINGRTPDCIHA